MTDIFQLRSGDATATVARHGAELVAWGVRGRDFLWTPEPEVWARTSPILFPIVGWAAGGVLRVGGKTYPIGVHGFAADRDFEVVDAGEESLRLRLGEDAATLASWPFRFVLEVEYRLFPASLKVTFRVANPAAGAMPYALGFHPGFRWPFSGAGRNGHRVVFEARERPSVPVITPRGLFSEAQRPVPFEGSSLPLDDMLLAREALCFLDARSRAVRFVAPDGASIGMTVDDFPHLALWSRPPAPFLSIEAWTGHGDPDGFAGDLAEKPSMRWLAPGETARHAVTLDFSPA